MVHLVETVVIYKLQIVQIEYNLTFESNKFNIRISVRMLISSHD